MASFAYEAAGRTRVRAEAWQAFKNITSTFNSEMVQTSTTNRGQPAQKLVSVEGVYTGFDQVPFVYKLFVEELDPNETVC